jgi:hypothetical protein
MEISSTAPAALTEPMRYQVNWGLLICLAACVSFWSAVVLGIVAAF